jgi:hypothetical protein
MGTEMWLSRSNGATRTRSSFAPHLDVKPIGDPFDQDEQRDEQVVAGVAASVIERFAWISADYHLACAVDKQDIAAR